MEQYADVDIGVLEIRDGKEYGGVLSFDGRKFLYRLKFDPPIKNELNNPDDSEEKQRERMEAIRPSTITVRDITYDPDGDILEIYRSRKFGLIRPRDLAFDAGREIEMDGELREFFLKTAGTASIRLYNDALRDACREMSVDTYRTRRVYRNGRVVVKPRCTKAFSSNYHLLKISDNVPIPESLQHHENGQIGNGPSDGRENMRYYDTDVL